MSPTSYQAAPPRTCIITHNLGFCANGHMRADAGCRHTCPTSYSAVRWRALMLLDLVHFRRLESQHGNLRWGHPIEGEASVMTNQEMKASSRFPPLVRFENQFKRARLELMPRRTPRVEATARVAVLYVGEDAGPSCSSPSSAARFGPMFIALILSRLSTAQSGLSCFRTDSSFFRMPKLLDSRQPFPKKHKGRVVRDAVGIARGDRAHHIYGWFWLTQGTVGGWSTRKSSISYGAVYLTPSARAAATGSTLNLRFSPGWAITC